MEYRRACALISYAAMMGGDHGGDGDGRRPSCVLSAEERETLERWARRPTSAQALAQRCRIVLACAEGLTNQQIAAAAGVHEVTVGKWRRALRGAAASTACTMSPGPASRARSRDADVERVIVKTLEETPRDATHWSTRSMAGAGGMSQIARSAASGGPSA